MGPSEKSKHGGWIYFIHKKHFSIFYFLFLACLKTDIKNKIAKQEIVV